MSSASFCCCCFLASTTCDLCPIKLPFLLLQRDPLILRCALPAPLEREPVAPGESPQQGQEGLGLALFGGVEEQHRRVHLQGGEELQVRERQNFTHRLQKAFLGKEIYVEIYAKM